MQGIQNCLRKVEPRGSEKKMKNLDDLTYAQKKKQEEDDEWDDENTEEYLGDYDLSKYEEND